MASRRGFLGALASVPFLKKLAEGEPRHVEAGGVPGKPQYMALLISKDGNRVQRNYPTPPGREVYEARAYWPAADMSLGSFPMAPLHRVERVAFRATGRMLNLAGGPQFKVYEEV